MGRRNVTDGGGTIAGMNLPVEQPLSSSESVTEWLGRLKAGDQTVGQQLWQRYVERLVRLADRKLGDAPKRVADEEDVVLSVFHAFLRGVADGRFTRLDDRDDLWQVLVMLTERKAIGARRWEQADKRGGREVRGGTAVEGHGGSGSAVDGLGQIADDEPTPRIAAAVREELSERLRQLEDDGQRRIVLGKLAGYRNAELATQLGLSLRAVERKLHRIRRQWRGESPS